MSTEINRPNPMNHAMLMGLEMGVWFTINFIVGAQQMRHPSLWLLSWLLTAYVAYGIYRAAQHFKHFECADKISFAMAYSYIMWLFLCASLVAAVLRFAYMQWLDTSYLSGLFEQTQMVMEQLAKEGALQTDVKEISEMMQELLSPIRFSVYVSMFDMFIGGFFGLILAPMVMRIRPKYVDSFKKK